MLKLIYNLIINFVSITSNPIVDFILFFVIATISFVVAYAFVGVIKDLLFNDSRLMSVVHWIARIAIVVGLIWLFRQIFAAIAWFLTLQWWIVILGVVGVLVIIVLFFVAKHKITH